MSNAAVENSIRTTILELVDWAREIGVPHDGLKIFMREEIFEELKLSELRVSADSLELAVPVEVDNSIPYTLSENGWSSDILIYDPELV